MKGLGLLCKERQRRREGGGGGGGGGGEKRRYCVACSLYCIKKYCLLPSGQAPSYETSLGHKFICTQTP